MSWGISDEDLDGIERERGFTPDDLDAARERRRNGDVPPPPDDVAVVSLEEFAAVEEPGAAALLGSEDSALIPEGGDVMIYGNGGVGKTTLSIDLACHLAAGQEWIGIPVPRPVRVLLIENEGPRPLLRKKLRRKLAAWDGSLDGNVRVFASPWGRFTFTTEAWREELALTVAGQDIDVLIVGPLTRVGMNEAGTLQDVVAFMDLVADLRDRCQRPLTVVLIHHESKSGKVSGAWEAAGDTLLHVQAAGNGHTVVFVQKARWSSAHSQQTLKLAWARGEGFRLEADRDLLAEVQELLSDGEWRTAREIASKEDSGGVGAARDGVQKLLDDHPELFCSRTGPDAQAVGRHPSATVWSEVAFGPKPPEPPPGLFGVETGGGLVASPLREATPPEPPHLTGQSLAQPPKPPEAPTPSETDAQAVSAGPPPTPNHDDGRDAARREPHR